MKHLKSEFDKLSFREFLAFLLAVVLMLSSIVCIFISMFIPPEGEIHDSVLVYYSISAAAASSLLGITMFFNGKLESYQSKVSDIINNIINEKVSPDNRHTQAPQPGPDTGIHLQRPAGC